MNEVVPHEIEWTPARVERFWNFYSSNTALAGSYFALSAGKSLLAFIGRRIKIGQAIDIGCGAGDLIGYLLEQGHQAIGADSSEASLAKVRTRFEGKPGFGGAVRMVDGRIDLPDSSADTAFILEVVEHMDDETLTSALAEAHRVLRTGGHIVLTTPNEEGLDASRIMCPECGGIFHRVQHVRAWSKNTLARYVEPLGFTTVTCEPTVLSQYQGVMGRLYAIAFRALRGRKPHLIYIGRKG